MQVHAVVPFIDLLGLTLWGLPRPRRLRMKGKCSHCQGKRDATGRYCKACRRAYFKQRRALKRLSA